MKFVPKEAEQMIKDPKRRQRNKCKKKEIYKKESTKALQY